MVPELLTVTPPVVLVDKSMALVSELVTAPVAGDRVVLVALMVPALLMALSVPDWSEMASETRLKGALALAIFLVGEKVLVFTWAVIPAPLPILMTGTFALGPTITPKALPWPMPLTVAVMVPAVVELPLTFWACTSRRGTKV